MHRVERYDVFELPCDRIWAHPDFNCRAQFAAHSAVELADSIRKEGQKFPIVVQPIEDVAGVHPDCDWRLIAGFRRFYAVEKFIKAPTIIAMIARGLNEREAKKLNLIENLERKDLNILEEARAIKTLFADDASLRQVAGELNRPTRWVHVRRRLLDLPEEIQLKAANGTFSATDLSVIAAQETPAAQLRCAQELEAAKKTGTSLAVGNRYGRTFRYRLSKSEISGLIARMYNMGLKGGIGPRVAARCAGYISDAELDEDIRQELRNNPV